MPLTNDEVISTLNGLIEVCKDGQEGFKTAAEGVSETATKNLFYQYSQQRGQFAGELQGLVRSLGGDPEKSGSVTGAMQRGWINLKTAITGQDEQAVLVECERGEDDALNNYRLALEKNLPANVTQLLRQQTEAIKQAHDRVRGLRDRRKTAKA